MAEAGVDRSAATGRPVARGVATGLADRSLVPAAGRADRQPVPATGRPAGPLPSRRSDLGREHPIFVPPLHAPQSVFAIYNCNRTILARTPP